MRISSRRNKDSISTSKSSNKSSTSDLASAKEPLLESGGISVAEDSTERYTLPQTVHREKAEVYTSLSTNVFGSQIDYDCFLMFYFILLYFWNNFPMNCNMNLWQVGVSEHLEIIKQNLMIFLKKLNLKQLFAPSTIGAVWPFA